MKRERYKRRPREADSTDEAARGGYVRSTEEASIMEEEGRGVIIQLSTLSKPISGVTKCR